MSAEIGEPVPRKLARRLIFYTVLFSASIALLATLGQLAIDYYKDLRAIKERFALIERSYLPSIVENVWLMDRGRLRLLLEGIENLEDFRHARVEAEGETLVQVGDKVVAAITRTYPLTYLYRDKLVEIGVLIVEASDEAVWNRILERTWYILGVNSLKTMLVAIFMAGLVYRMITRRLASLGDQAAKIDFNHPDRMTALTARQNDAPDDEIDRLAAAFNQLIARLRHSHLELRALNENLESRIEERTRELAESRDILALAERVARMGAWLRDIATNTRVWSDELFRIFDLDPVKKTLTDAEVLAMVHPEDRKRMQETMAAADKGEMPFEIECRIVKPNGEIRHIHSRADLLRDGDGRPFRLVGMVMDITDRVQATRRMRTLAHAIEQSPDMIIITDAKGRIEYVNPSFTHLTGYSAAEAIGKTPSLIRSDLTPPEVHQRLWKTITAGHSWYGELRDTRKDGTIFWVQSTISPVVDSDGTINHYVSVQKDISERKQSEFQLLEAKEQAILANRAKTEMLANMSHELRTPLNAIIGFSNLMIGLMAKDPAGEKYRAYCVEISSAGEYLLQIINDILDVAAIEAGHLALQEELVGIREMAETAVRLIRPRAESARVGITVDIPADLPPIYADLRRMKQIMLNLVSNAVKYTNEGGEVRVAARRDQDGSTVIVVADTGIGMDEKDITIALSPFGRADNEFAQAKEGTGLGLPLTVKLVEMHDGILEIKSAKGIGTEITVRLPSVRTEKALALS